jgi:prepilin peptidase CpaA
MLLAAVVNLRTLRVPNRLSLLATAAGWIAALLISVGLLPSAGGGLVPSLAAALLGGMLLLPFYARGGLGAGCVKMQMAFGAWVGCALGLSEAAALTAMATFLGGLITAVGALLVLKRPTALPADAAGDRLFPAQATLSLGAIASLAAVLLRDWSHFA